jgi:hypothetical protein
MWKNTYCTAGQATDYNMTRRMRIAYWVTKSTDTCYEYVILSSVHGNIGYAKELQCYVLHTLPVLLSI